LRLVAATAHTCIVPVKKDDIFILIASDGLSANLWDEVLDEVVRFRRGLLVDSPEGTQEADGLKTKTEAEEHSLNTTTEVEAKMMNEDKVKGYTRARNGVYNNGNRRRSEEEDAG